MDRDRLHEKVQAILTAVGVIIMRRHFTIDSSFFLPRKFESNGLIMVLRFSYNIDFFSEFL